MRTSAQYAQHAQHATYNVCVYMRDKVKGKQRFSTYLFFSVHMRARLRAGYRTLKSCAACW